MVQLTPQTPVESKMSEERNANETPGGTTAKAELQAVRFEWPGLQVTPSSDMLFYKPNQRRAGEVAQVQGIQSVPAIWLPSPHGAPWQYSGLTESSVATGHPAPPPPLGWYGSKHVIACGGMLIMLLLLLVHYLERIRLLSRFRPRRSHVRNTLKFMCQFGGEKPKAKIPMKANDSFNITDKPPSYSRYPRLAVELLPKEKNSNEYVLPFSYILSTGTNKVPRVFFVQTYKDKEIMETLGLTKAAGHSSHEMKINVPTQVDENNQKMEKANVVLEIKDPETESGCVIGMNVLVNKDDNDGFFAKKNEGIPFSVTVEKLDADPKKAKKGDGEAKK